VEGCPLFRVFSIYSINNQDVGKCPGVRNLGVSVNWGFHCTLKSGCGQLEYTGLCCNVTIAVYITSHRVGELPTTVELTLNYKS